MTVIAMIWYNLLHNGLVLKGGRHPRMKGGDTMTVFEALSLMLTFGTLVIMLSSSKKK
ncbi:putative holin-like toxin [Brevibacillus centrosporus]|uniref:putative holin-like toxin n=1 Tax=Brevibacillus centrosporus TaxID=54910 RepID=UPI003D2025D1